MRWRLAGRMASPRARFACALCLVALLAPAALAQDAEGTCVEDLAIEVDHDAARVTLTWRGTPGGVVYDVHRAIDGGASAHVGTTTLLTFTDEPAPDGVLDYRVAANGHPPDTCPAVSAHIGGEPPPPTEPVCASDLVAQASGRDILLSWAAVPGAVSYDVLRAQGDAALAPYAVVGGSETSFLDEDVEVGSTYRYAVSANGLPPEGVRCEEAEATAVPFFPGSLLGIAAIVTILGAIAFVSWSGRRR